MKHDVFISFRSRDTADNFASNLCGCLRTKRIKTFVYDLELRAGETYEETLDTIQESKISVIVFSENFGDSQWCLDEVIAILECSQKFGQIVIPIFYDVDPLDIRNQTGRFGDGFARRRDKAEQHQGWLDSCNQTKRWRNGLTRTTYIEGWGTTGNMRDEEMFVHDIARDIENKVLSLRPSRTKVLIEWSLVITNLMMEIPTCILDQISATQKASYALATMLMSLLACLLCLIDLVHKGRVERVVWKWTWPIPWFYYPTRRSDMFGSFAEMVGLLCGLCQTILTVINFSFITRKVDAPIKVSAWPIIFAVGVLFTMYVKTNKTS